MKANSKTNKAPLETIERHLEDLSQSSLRTSKGILKYQWQSTPLGHMLAICNENELVLLEFLERKGLREELFQLREETGAVFQAESSDILSHARHELQQYFSGTLQSFQTPLALSGTPFQKQVWNELLKIPFGATRSYKEIAHQCNKLKASRAVAQANARNRLALIVPCHRVISSDGGVSGYAGGIERKIKLLKHEQKSNPKIY